MIQQNTVIPLHVKKSTNVVYLKKSESSSGALGLTE
jgi:hypothetical protein